MSNHLTIEEKIEELRDAGWYIEKRNGGYIFFHQKKNALNPTWCLPAYADEIKEIELTSEREIAKIYKNRFLKKRNYKKTMKKETNGKERVAERAMRAHETFDDAPSNERILEERRGLY